MITSPIPAMRPEDLPVWMRPVPRATNWGPVLAALIGLLAAWSFILQPGIADNTGMFNSGFMVADLADSMREGRWVPLWSPTVQGGYGAPIPLYIPQGPAYAAALIEVFFTGDTSEALRLAAIIFNISMAIAVYAWVARSSFAEAGLLAAALASFSPYLGLYGPHIVGDLTGMLSATLLPTLLWAMHRLNSDSSPYDALMVSGVMAGLVLTDPRTAVVGLAIGLIQTPWQIKPTARIVLATLLGVLLASVFWFPALLENQTVNWRDPIVRFSEPFRIQALFAPVGPLDPAAYNPEVRWTLGPWLALTTLLATAWGVSVGLKQGRFLVRTGTVGAILAVFTQVTTADPRWVMPVLTLCAAAVGAQWLGWFRTSQRLRIVTAASIGLTIAIALPIWITPIPSVSGEFTPVAALEYEADTSAPAPLPAWQSFPSVLPSGAAPAATFIGSGAQNNQPNRVLPGSAARLSPLIYTTHGSSWQVSSSASTSLTFAVPAFPGWRADLNGEMLPVSARASDGLLEATLPPVVGGLLTLTLGSTAIRTAAWGIVWIAVLGLALWTRQRIQHRKIASLNVSPLGRPVIRLTAVTLVLSAAFLSLAMPENGIINLRAAPFTSLAEAELVDFVAESGAKLLAYDIGNLRATAGNTFTLRLYWQAQQPIEQNAQIRLVLISVETGKSVLFTAYHHPGGIPMRQWPSDRFITDTILVSLPESVLPGSYQFAIEMAVCDAALCPQPQPLRFRTQREDVGLSRALLPTTVNITTP